MLGVRLSTQPCPAVLVTPAWARLLSQTWASVRSGPRSHRRCSGPHGHRAEVGYHEQQRQHPANARPSSHRCHLVLRAQGQS